MQLIFSSGFLKFIMAWSTPLTCAYVPNVHSSYTYNLILPHTHISLYIQSIRSILIVGSVVCDVYVLCVGSDGVYLCCRRVKNSYPRSLKNGIAPVSATSIVSFKLDKITRSNTCQNICERHISTEDFGIDKHIWENISHISCHNTNSVRIKSWWFTSERMTV